jgi:nucleotide-binding universal stress UspA family protein
MFQHLLVPLDGTPVSADVLPTVRLLAEALRAKVTLFHLVEKGAPALVHGLPHLTNRSEAEAYLKALQAEYFAGRPGVDTHVHAPEFDDVPQGLAEHGQELGGDLIVFCPHGTETWRSFFSGSMAQRVAGHGATPVLLVRPQGALPVFPFKRLVCPLDGHPEHENSIGFASTLAQVAKANLTLVRVVRKWSDLSGAQAAVGSYLPGTMQTLLKAEEEQTVEYLTQRLRPLLAAGLQAGAQILHGEPVHQISEYAQAAQIDLVVLGTHGKYGTQAFWEGSLTAKLLSQLPSSFLLVPTAPAPKNDPA